MALTTGFKRLLVISAVLGVAGAGIYAYKSGKLGALDDLNRPSVSTEVPPVVTPLPPVATEQAPIQSTVTPEPVGGYPPPDKTIDKMKNMGKL